MFSKITNIVYQIMQYINEHLNKNMEASPITTQAVRFDIKINIINMLDITSHIAFILVTCDYIITFY